MATLNSGRLEHVGIAVDDPEAVTALYEELLRILPYKQESVDAEGVRTHFLHAGGAKLELLEALGEGSPIARHLEKRGEGLHHLAFEVDDIHAQLRRVREAGYTPLSEEPRQGADGKLIFFLHPRDTHGVLVEFCQSERGRLEPDYISLDGERLAVYEFGSAASPPLVMLHGAAGSVQHELEPLARALEPYFHVLALDFAGHGRSGTFRETPFSFDLFTRNVTALLDAYQLRSTFLYGFSMGGAVALHLAQRAPNRVERVAVYNTHVFWEEASVRRMVDRLHIEEIEDKPSSKGLARIHGDWKALFRRTAAFVRTLPELSSRSAMLKDLDVPVLVGAADRDPLFPLEGSVELHRLLPKSRFAVLPGSSHRMLGVHVQPYSALVHSFFLQEER